MGSDDGEALPLATLPEPDAPAPAPDVAPPERPVPPDVAPDTEVPPVDLSLETPPEVAAPLAPVPDVDGLLDMPPEVEAPLPVAFSPEGDGRTLGAAVDELPLPGDGDVTDGVVTDGDVADEPVLGEALGVLLAPAASATWLHRSKSAWVGVADCAWARLPTASKLPAEIRAATCRTVIM